MSVKFSEKPEYDISDLREIMSLLRSAQGCPWDREQTHETIRSNMLEEAYEAAEAIDLGDRGKLREELGDVLLQVVFHSQIESENGGFDFDGVCDGICKKLIRRHPHVFSDTIADTSEQVLDNWAKIKSGEKGTRTVSEKIDSIAKTLPGLMRGQKIAKILRKSGKEDPGADEEDEVCALIWQAVKAADRSGADAEEKFNRFLDRLSESLK